MDFRTSEYIIVRMTSKWFHFKEEALTMRRRGVSTRDVEKKLGIPRSTLSYWFTNIKLHPRYLKRLKMRHDHSLIKARMKAVKWHNEQKMIRMQQASHDAQKTLSQIDSRSNVVAELALSLLYLGEGAKKSDVTAMGNSDPLILRFFVKMMHRLYDVQQSEMKCELHLRADQNSSVLTKYWSETLGIPVSNFRKPSLDKRTLGRTTYTSYKGVCIVSCGRVAIQRKLVYIATTFCNKITE